MTFIRNGSFWDLVTALGHIMILIISRFIVQPEFFSVLSIMFWPDVSGQKDTIPINPLYTIIHKYPDLSLEIASKSYYFISSQVLQFLSRSVSPSEPCWLFTVGLLNCQFSILCEHLSLVVDRFDLEKALKLC